MSSLSFVGLAFYVLVLIGAFAVRSAAGFGEGYVIEDSPDPIIVAEKEVDPDCIALQMSNSNSGRSFSLI